MVLPTQHHSAASIVFSTDMDVSSISNDVSIRILGKRLKKSWSYNDISISVEKTRLWSDAVSADTSNSDLTRITLGSLSSKKNYTRLDPQGMGCAAATWFLGRAQMWSYLVKFPVHCRHFSQTVIFPYILACLFKKSKKVIKKCPKTGSEPMVPFPCFPSFSWYFWKTENPTSRFALLFKKFHRCRYHWAICEKER